VVFRLPLWSPIYAVALRGLLAAALLSGCTDPESPGETADTNTPTVATIAVAPHEIVDERRWPGRLEPLERVQVRAPGDGQIRSINVRYGDRVEQGEALLTVHDPDLHARIDVLEERASNLSAQLRRLEQLSDTAVTETDIDEARLRLLEARESIASTEAKISANQVLAPVTGQVLEFYEHLGSHVSEGESLLVIESDDSWGVRLSIPSYEAPRLSKQEQLELRTASGETLTIDRLITLPSPHDGYLRVEVYTRPDKVLARGQANLHHAETRSALLVPWTAVANDESGTWVARVTADGQSIERQPVTLGRAQAKGVEVTSGLDPDDLVVRYEPRSFNEGQTVEPRVGEL